MENILSPILTDCQKVKDPAAEWVLATKFGSLGMSLDGIIVLNAEL